MIAPWPWSSTAASHHGWCPLQLLGCQSFAGASEQLSPSPAAFTLLAAHLWAQPGHLLAALLPAGPPAGRQPWPLLGQYKHLCLALQAPRPWFWFLCNKTHLCGVWPLTWVASACLSSSSLSPPLGAGPPDSPSSRTGPSPSPCPFCRRVHPRALAPGPTCNPRVALRARSCRAAVGPPGRGGGALRFEALPPYGGGASAAAPPAPCLHPQPLPSRRCCGPSGPAPRPGRLPFARRVNAAPPPRGLPWPWTPTICSPAARRGTWAACGERGLGCGGCGRFAASPCAIPGLPPSAPWRAPRACCLCGQRCGTAGRAGSFPASGWGLGAVCISCTVTSA